MPIARRNTPPTSQIKEQVSLLSSLSAWTDTEETEKSAKKAKGGYEELPAGEEGQPVPIARKVAVWLDVEGDTFNIFIGFVIIANAVVIGLETDFGRGKFTILEHLFNSIFLVEICLRVKQQGSEYFKEPWNIFDCLLVLIGSLDLWILPLLTVDSGASSMGYKLSAMRMLRVLRLMRVLRVIRLFRMFHQLFLIMQAFTKAFQMVLLISILVVILNYVCAIILTQAVGQPSDEWDASTADQLKEWFGSISASMQTLFIIMTLSDVEKIWSTLTKVLPAWIISPCFVLYIMVTSYTMVSLITGIISESLITSQQEYKRRKMQQIEGKKKEVASSLREFLHEVHDPDANGCVEAEDLKQSVRGDTELLAKLASMGVSIDEKGVLGLVDHLSESSGKVSLDYFVDKLTNLIGMASASHVVDLRYQIVRTQQQLASVESTINLLAKKIIGPDGFDDKKETKPESGSSSSKYVVPTTESGAAGTKSEVKPSAAAQAKQDSKRKLGGARFADVPDES